MADPRYLPKDRNQRFFRAIEEAGEFLQAIGKAGRWGMDNFHPDVPVDQRETNAAWVKRELIDLRDALDALEPDLDAEIARQQREAEVRALSNYLADRHDLKTETLVAIADTCGVSVEWLAAGRGPIAAATTEKYQLLNPAVKARFTEWLKTDDAAHVEDER